MTNEYLFKNFIQNMYKIHALKRREQNPIGMFSATEYMSSPNNYLKHKHLFVHTHTLPSSSSSTSSSKNMCVCSLLLLLFVRDVSWLCSTILLLNEWQVCKPILRCLFNTIHIIKGSVCAFLAIFECVFVCEWLEKLSFCKIWRLISNKNNSWIIFWYTPNQQGKNISIRENLCKQCRYNVRLLFKTTLLFFLQRHFFNQFFVVVVVLV